ncbi:hypothetical protein [Zavarzinella formosa]|uniref:hypothetical protein n=1 Tax=Zavarzinella formosa TaxID=360055 RepID=UPI000368AC66|nr:hypothetical protein [Zavarzinella formosa]
MSDVKTLLVTTSGTSTHDIPVGADGFTASGVIKELLGKRGWVLIADRSLSSEFTVWSVEPKQNSGCKASMSINLRRNTKAELALESLTGQRLFVIGDMLFVGAISNGPGKGQASEIGPEKVSELMRLSPAHGPC